MTDGTTKPIAHKSRTLLPVEKNYSQIEKRLWGLYLQSQSFTVLFMVNTLRYRLTTSHYSPFLAQRKVRLFTQPTDCKGEVQSCLIIISKWCTYCWINSAMQIPKYKEPLEDIVIASLQYEGELKITPCNSVRELLVTLDQIKQALCNKDKNFGKGWAYYKRFLYMRWCVTLQRTCCDSVDTAETYFERFSHWPSRE